MGKLEEVLSFTTLYRGAYIQHSINVYTEYVDVALYLGPLKKILNFGILKKTPKKLFILSLC